MGLSKIVLIIVGVVAILMGIMALMGWPYGAEVFREPLWHAWAKIVIGVIAVIIPFIDKK
jgi:hypothetical protein